jgi:abortive infection bacteriophage resistance protein
MCKVATNTITQVQILKSRGMILDCDEAKVKEILHDIGYYRLGFYWNPFEMDDDHNFKEGTKFSDVVSLYYLDVDLRNILMRYINRIEINFRSNVVYYTSNCFKESPNWFIDPHVMEKSYIKVVDDHYTDAFKKKHKAIKLHHKKYINDKYAPAWKTLEFFTFGAILKIYKSLRNTELRERISKKYDVMNVSKFVNLMETIVFVRNSCAHGNVLFDLKTPRGISKLPQIEFNNNDRHSLDSAIRVIQFILGHVSGGRKSEMEAQVSALLDEHKDNETIRMLIESEIGYQFK